MPAASIKLHVSLTAAERVSLANAVGNQHLTVVDSLIRKQLMEAISGGFDTVIFETTGIWSLTRIVESLIKHVDKAMLNTSSVTIFEGLGVVKARLCRKGNRMITHKQAQTAIAKAEPFKASNLRGIAGTVHDVGHLPDPVKWLYRHEDQPITYTVLSYNTPIAWLAGDTWVVPDVSYSVTTSRHQSTVRMATGVRPSWETGLSVDASRGPRGWF